MRRLTRIHGQVKRVERTLAARPPFADPMDANRAMFVYQQRGILPSDERQAEFLKRWDEVLKAMDASMKPVRMIPDPKTNDWG